MDTMTFFLGCGEPHWLEKTSVPLFVSRRRFARRKRTLPIALGPWALDSGGFTELSLYGDWSITPLDYAHQVHRLWSEVGNLTWAAPMDWMCEPFVLRKTGLTVGEHQRRTVENYERIVLYAPHLPWVPVLQGWTLDDYMRCVELYDKANIDLTKQRLVGLGTVCRRQGTRDAEIIIRELWRIGIPLHGFGFKVSGLRRVAHYLRSADSMAWSYEARLRSALPDCPHKRCANCLRWALRWRERVLRDVRRTLQQPAQLLLEIPA